MKLRENNNLTFKNGVIELNNVFYLHQENTGQQQFEYLIGNKVLPSEKVNIFKSNISENERISKKFNFQYKHIIFPAKAVAYSEDFLKIGIEIRKIAPDECINLPSVYYPEFHKEDFPNDDIHNNIFGITKLLKKICIDFNLEPLPKFTVKKTKTRGDLSRMYDQHERERIILDKFIFHNESIIENSLRRKNYSKHYSLEKYIKGNAGHLDYLINPLALNEKRIILFGDSFFRYFLDIFSLLFNEVIYIRNPYVQEDIIKVLKPDIVLSGNAERYMINIPDALNPMPYFLYYFRPEFNNQNIDPTVIKAFKVLFSGRESNKFKQFKQGLEINIVDKLSSPYIIKVDDIISHLDATVCFDIAQELEATDVKKAFHLMEIAHLARPNRALIKEKYLEYSEKIINMEC